MRLLSMIWSNLRFNVWRSFVTMATNQLIFGFQILDLRDHFSASLILNLWSSLFFVKYILLRVDWLSVGHSDNLEFSEFVLRWIPSSELSFLPLCINTITQNFLKTRGIMLRSENSEFRIVVFCPILKNDNSEFFWVNQNFWLRKHSPSLFSFFQHLQGQ